MKSLKAWFGRTQTLTSNIGQFLSEHLAGSEAGRVCAELATWLAPRLPANDEGVLSDQSLGVPPPSLRTALWRAAGLRLGQGANILGELNIKGDAAWRDYLSLGADTRVTGQLNVELAAAVAIGEGVQIGHNVTLRTLDDQGLAGELHIGDGSSLCAGCTVMPGVSIGKRAIVAPGAVVTDDVPESTMVAGSPARVVLQLEESPESGVVVAESSESSGPETTRSPGLRVAS
jgi:carbonic anhydrase/acetyltransferase-like protein (isoleucine patch superfamily)